MNIGSTEFQMNWKYNTLIWKYNIDWLYNIIDKFAADILNTFTKEQ